LPKKILLRDAAASPALTPLTLITIAAGDKNSLTEGEQNFPEYFHLPEYDRFSWQQISHYKLLKQGHWANCS